MTVQIPFENVLQRHDVVPVPDAPAVTPNVPFPPLVVTTPLVVSVGNDGLPVLASERPVLLLLIIERFPVDPTYLTWDTADPPLANVKVGLLEAKVYGLAGGVNPVVQRAVFDIRYS